MNTYELKLTSLDTDYTTVYSPLIFQDHTKLILDVSGLNEKVLPIYMAIDWGDGKVQTFDNNVYVQGRDNVNIFRYSPLLTASYDNEYYPSETSLYKTLSAQVLVHFSNGDDTWIILPIKIRTNDYFESVGDLTLINNNILPLSSNNIEYQFKTDIGAFTVELNN